MKPFNFSYYRNPRGAEIGPQLETEQKVCKNKTDAIKTGKLTAKQADWRLIQITDIDNNIIF